MDQTLTSNFLPFKSETVNELPNPDDVINFSYNLWKNLYTYLHPSVIVCMGEVPFNNFGNIFLEQGFQITHTNTQPIGWGNVGYTLQEIVFQSRELALVRIPHLSRFRVMDRWESKQQVNELVSFIAVKLNRTETQKTNGLQRLDIPSIEESLPEPSIISVSKTGKRLDKAKIGEKSAFVEI